MRVAVILQGTEFLSKYVEDHYSSNEPGTPETDRWIFMVCIHVLLIPMFYLLALPGMYRTVYKTVQ